jgi:hypothetical protein
MNSTEQMPLDASSTIELPLTADQAELLGPLLTLQRCHDRSVIFMLPAQSCDPAVRKGWLRLQFKVIPRKAAMRVLKILREEGNE